ncbi:MAG: hypothetical protein ABSB52_12140 [Acidimicrobiales bacterium]|jgi:Flp pilus assembly protein TadG
MRARGGGQIPVTSRRDRRAEPEQGSFTPFVMLLCVALMAVLALIVDGGRALGARDTAYLEAEQAARVGATQLSAASLHEGLTAFQIAGATAAAERYMSACGHPGSVVVAGSAVIVTVRAYALATPLLAMIGIDQLQVSASAAATVVVG